MERRTPQPIDDAAMRGITLACLLSALFWLAVVGLVLWSSSARAQLLPEAGVGFAHATARHDGTWWQRAFPHQLNLDHPSVSLGLRMDAGHWRTHLDAIWFGRYGSDAWAIPNDPAYDPATDACVGPCLPRAHYIGHGWVGAFKLTAGWHTLGRWQWGLHGGVLRYREAWSLDVPDWYTATQQPDGSWRVKYRVPVHTRDVRWAFGTTVGASLTRGRWTLGLDWYRDGGGFPGHNGTWPPIWRWHTVFSLVRTF